MSGSVPGLETKSSGLAIFLSFLWPGLGHVYLGRIIRGVITAFLTLLIYLGAALSVAAYWDAMGGLSAWRMTEFKIESEKRPEDFVLRANGQSHYASVREIVKGERRQVRMFRQWALGSLVASLAWWVWAMMSARRLCGRHNLKVFRLSAMSPEEIRRTFDGESSTTWTRHVLNVLKKARAEFGEFWSGDPRLPYQGWFGRLARDHVIVAATLIASLLGNAAWLVFSTRNKWFRASGEQILDEVKRGLPHTYSEGWQLLTFVGWGLGVVAILFASIVVIGTVVGSVMWFIANLRAERSHETGRGGR